VSVAHSSTVTIFPPCTLAHKQIPPRLLDIARCSNKSALCCTFQDKKWCRGCRNKFEKQVRALSETVRLDKGWAVCGDDLQLSALIKKCGGVLLICMLSATSSIEQKVPQGHGHTLFFHFFYFTRPQKSEKIAVTREKNSNPKISLFNSNPQSAVFTFFTLGEIGRWSQEAPRQGPNRAFPLETPCLGFCTSERTFTSGECLRRQGFPT